MFWGWVNAVVTHRGVSVQGPTIRGASRRRAVGVTRFNAMWGNHRMRTLFKLTCRALFTLVAVQVGVSGGSEPGTEDFEVRPPSVELIGPGAVRGFLVHARRADGRDLDLTHRVTYRTESPHFRVDGRGVLRAVSDGTGEVEIAYGDQRKRIEVRVAQTGVPRAFHFEDDVLPILSKYGCNASGCHGKAEGQNGFKLSVFGFDPSADFAALTKEGRGRRTFVAASERSLLLTKASGGIPHGGGVRIALDSREYNTLKGWIAAGTPLGKPDAARVARIEIQPAQAVLAADSSQQLRVVAYYSDGRQVDVTSIVKYQSNSEGLASVDAAGVVRIGAVPGQVAVMATYMGAVDTFQALIPREQAIEDYPAVSETNFIDGLVHTKLKKLNIIPSGHADDAEYLRRTYLDIIGTLPTVEQAREFLQDERADKRALLVDGLLKRPEYAVFWAMKWSDLLRVDRRALGHKNAYEYYTWIRESFARNRPYDQFVTDILALQGPTKQAPQVNFYRVVGDAGKLASAVSQIFLGIRIECAQCHHHPFDRWSQRDYYGMSALFQQVNRKGTTRGELMLAAGDPETKHPRTGQPIYAYPLGEPMPEKSPPGDRRGVLVNWMTSPQNRWFASNLVNRMWAHFMGRGLVEPVDDVRDTNPPSNPELMKALADHFVASGFDIHQLIRTITASRTYQRSSQPNTTNQDDEQNYSRALLKRLDAEVLFDAVCDVTGHDEKFVGVPHGYRAIELWDSAVDHYFLSLFGRPSRKTACECERVGEPTVGQVLHVLNSPEIAAMIGHEAGHVTRLVDTTKTDQELVQGLYLMFFSRFPNTAELETALNYFQQSPGSRREDAEDLSWSLMNTLEFVFNH